MNKTDYAKEVEKLFFSGMSYEEALEKVKEQMEKDNSKVKRGAKDDE